MTDVHCDMEGGQLWLCTGHPHSARVIFCGMQIMFEHSHSTEVIFCGMQVISWGILTPLE